MANRSRTEHHQQRGIANSDRKVMGSKDPLVLVNVSGVQLKKNRGVFKTKAKF